MGQYRAALRGKAARRRKDRALRFARFLRKMCVPISRRTFSNQLKEQLVTVIPLTEIMYGSI